MKKKSFISVYGALAMGLAFANFAPLLAGAATNGNGLAFLDQGKQPLAVTVSYYSDIRSRGVAWTTMDAANGVLEVVAAKSEEQIDWSKAQKIQASVKVEANNYYTYKAHVENLTEDTYFYRAVSTDGGKNGLYSDVGSFTVDHDETEVNFIYATDSQDYSEEGFAEWEKLVGAAYQTMPEAQFFAMGGDIVNDSHSWGTPDLDQWIYAMDMPKEYFMHSVFMPTAGNHDDLDETFTNRYAIDYQGPTVSGGYYSFDYANMHFVALNTNENAWGNEFAAQLEWLERDLEETDKQWKIVMVHKGPISTGDHSRDGDVEQVRELLLPLMAKHEVDVVLQGHDHVYARSKPYSYGKNEQGDYYNGKTPNMDETLITETVNGQSVTYSVEPNGTFYMTANDAGRKSYPPVDYDKNVIYPALNPYNGQYMSQQIQKQMFTTIRIKDNALHFDAYIFDGATATLYDSYYVKKDTHKAVESRIEALPNVDEADVFDYADIQAANEAYGELVPNALKKMNGGYKAKLQALVAKFPASVCAEAYSVATAIANLKEIAPTQNFLDSLKALKRRYADLTDQQKAYVINADDLAKKETGYVDMLYAQAVTNLAKQCANDGTVSAFEVYAAYDLLTETQKNYVDLSGVKRPEENAAGNAEKGGCGSSMTASSIGITALGFALCLMIKKFIWRKENA